MMIRRRRCRRRERVSEWLTESVTVWLRTTTTTTTTNARLQLVLYSSEATAFGLELQQRGQAHYLLLLLLLHSSRLHRKKTAPFPLFCYSFRFLSPPKGFFSLTMRGKARSKIPASQPTASASVKRRGQPHTPTAHINTYIDIKKKRSSSLFMGIAQTVNSTKKNAQKIGASYFIFGLASPQIASPLCVFWDGIRRGDFTKFTFQTFVPIALLRLLPPPPLPLCVQVSRLEAIFFYRLP